MKTRAFLLAFLLIFAGVKRAEADVNTNDVFTAIVSTAFLAAAIAVLIKACKGEDPKAKPEGVQEGTAEDRSVMDLLGRGDLLPPGAGETKAIGQVLPNPTRATP